VLKYIFATIFVLLAWALALVFQPTVPIWTAVVATVVIVGGLVAFVVIRMLAGQRAAAQIEKGLRDQAMQHAGGIRPDMRGEIAAMEAEFQKAVQALKKSKLGRNARDVLGLLPWYVIIGPSASGKTTAIRSSGIKMPLGKGAKVRGVGGTRNCDWWMTNEAILLDTAGRWSTEDDDRDEWLALRRPFFNASYAAVLFDEHPYVTAGDVATIKLTGKEQAQTRAMDRGRRLEDVIGKWWADEHGCEVYEPNKLYVCGRVMATVDRLVDDGGAEPLMPVEIKTANVIAPEPLPYWLCQCQAIMLCTGAQRLALVWFDSTMDLRSRTIEANARMMESINEGAERFMAAIDMGMVPDWVGLSYANQTDLHPEARVPPVELDDAGFNTVMALRFVRSQRIAAEREEERIKAEMAGLLGDHEAGTFGGREIIRWSNVKGRRDLDTKRLAAEHPEIVADYTVQRDGTRRMVLVGTDEEAA